MDLINVINILPLKYKETRKFPFVYLHRYFSRFFDAGSWSRKYLAV